MSNVKEKVEKDVLDTKTLNIFEKKQRISNEIGFIEKNLDVGTGNYKYRAVSEADVLTKVQKYENKYRVYSYVSDIELISSERFTNDKGNVMFNDIVKIMLTIVNLDNPTETTTIPTISRGLDNGDKGFGKAITYARKYALLNAYKLGTGEDPDQDKNDNQKEMSIDETKANVINILNEHTDLRDQLCKHYGLIDIEEITKEQLTPTIKSLIKKGLWE